MFDDKELEDRLLEYFKTIPNDQIIINLYLSYMAAIEFIMHMELDREYVEFTEMEKKKKQAQKKEDPIKQYLKHLEQRTNWDDTEH